MSADVREAGRQTETVGLFDLETTPLQVEQNGSVLPLAANERR